MISNHVHRLFWLVFFLLLLGQNSFAQPAITTVGTADREVFTAGLATADGGALAVGWKENAATSRLEGWSVRFDPLGNPAEQHFLNDPPESLSLSLLDGASDRGYWAGGTNDEGAVLVRLSENGAFDAPVLVDQNITYQATDLVATADGGVVFTGRGADSLAFVAKLDTAGQLMFVNRFTDGDIGAGWTLAPLTDSTFLWFAQASTFDRSISHFFVSVLDANGVESGRDTLFSGPFSSVFNPKFHLLNDGFALVMDRLGLPFSPQPFGYRFSDQGAITETYEFPSLASDPDHQYSVSSVFEDASGALWAAGIDFGGGSNQHSTGFIYSFSGDRITQTIGSTADEAFSDAWSYGTHFWAVGFTKQRGAGSTDGLLAMSNSDFELPLIQLSGTLVLDPNCDGSGSLPVPHWLVTAEQNGNFAQFTTDELGAFSIALNPQEPITVRGVQLNSNWEFCEDSLLVPGLPADSSARIQLGVRSLRNCADVRVELAVPFLRRCFDNTTQLFYTNQGAVTAENTVLSLELDDRLELLNSSAPFTVIPPNTFQFSVGNVLPFATESIDLTFGHDCDSVDLGAILCQTAIISADGLCPPDTLNWDGSHLETTAVCLGDSAVLTITNVGAQPMSVATNTIILEDQIMLRYMPIQLAAGADTTFVVYPNGATITLNIAQTPNNPTAGQSVIMLTGCGGSSTTNPGFQFPYFWNSDTIRTECTIVRGSFDPNDKQAFPKGVTSENRIAAGVPLEYTIRFQNTGTDTAFRILIIDTLSENVALNSLEFIASSHPATWKISPDRVLQVVYDPIALPDSTANLLASQGFVRFRIATKNDVPDDQQLINNAGIYFDFNAPIITNTVRHTFGLPKWIFTVVQAPNLAVDEGWQLAPNPVADWTYISRKGDHKQQIRQWALYDVNGRMLEKREHARGVAMDQLDCSQLPAGTYFLILEEELTATTVVLTFVKF